MFVREKDRESERQYVCVRAGACVCVCSCECVCVCTYVCVCGVRVSVCARASSLYECVRETEFMCVHICTYTQSADLYSLHRRLTCMLV